MKVAKMIVAKVDGITGWDESDQVVDYLAKLIADSKKHRIADFATIGNAVVATSEKMLDEFVREILSKRIRFYKQPGARTGQLSVRGIGEE